MTVCTTKEALKIALASHTPSPSVGFVPTMGALHQGHLSLVSKALSDNDIAVVSVFVNPTQFDNASDLEKYPRNLEEDIALLETLNGTIIVFSPDASHLYGHQIQSKSYRFGGLEYEMEGRHRKGHFDGVGTVLNLLFRAVAPTRAYFGEKDFQQLQIVRKLVSIEKLPLTVVGCPIIREKNGLAMSSRNKRLTSKQRDIASFIHKNLEEVAAQFKHKSIPQITQYVKTQFENEPLLRLEYFEIANEATLKTAQRKRKQNTYRAFMAVFAGPVRLIDNKRLN